MKSKPVEITIIALIALALTALAAWAADLVIQNQTIVSTQNYDSPEGIIFDHVVMTATADVAAASSYELTLKPGTKIAVGARFVGRMKDNDGLPNRCEMQYFGDLTHEPDVDDDGDGYTNLEECQMGTDPSFPEDIGDRDNDGLPDDWEMRHFGNLDHDCNSDSNGDGVYDCVEYRLGRDPNATDSKGPGIYYQYDKLGRTRKIERIPSR